MSDVSVLVPQHGYCEDRYDSSSIEVSRQSACLDVVLLLVRNKHGTDTAWIPLTPEEALRLAEMLTAAAAKRVFG